MNYLTKTVLTCSLLFVFNLIQAQETHTITLYVDTSDITKSNANSVSNFGQDPSISNEDYTVDVNLGDQVIWQGVSSSSDNDVVEIVSINYEGGARVFDKNTIKGSDGTVSAVVSAGKKGDEEKYTINFRVIRNGKRLSGTFKIDPKIRVRL